MAYNALGYGLAEQGRYDEAIPLIEKALSLQPDEPDFLDSYAFVLAGKGDYDAAIGKYAAALKHDPNNAVIHLHQAQAFEKLGRQEEAKREFENAYRLNPDLKDHPE